jgi:TolA-binding protein
MAKYKSTGCARFFFFLVIFVPIAYFGAQYLMESGKWDDIRDKLENVADKDDKNSVEKAIEKKPNLNEMNSTEVQQKLQQLLDKINEQAKQIETQEETIHKQNILIDQLKQQLQITSSNTDTKSSGGSTNSNSDSKGTSLEDLLKEADKALKKN